MLTVLTQTPAFVWATGVKTMAIQVGLAGLDSGGMQLRGSMRCQRNGFEGLRHFSHKTLARIRDRETHGTDGPVRGEFRRMNTTKNTLRTNSGVGDSGSRPERSSSGQKTEREESRQC
jgi:hypothetical protein